MKKEHFDQLMAKWGDRAEGRLAAEPEKPKARFNLAGMAAAGIGVHGVKS